MPEPSAEDKAKAKEDEARRMKYMARASLQVMSLSGRIKRTSRHPSATCALGHVPPCSPP